MTQWTKNHMLEKIIFFSQFLRHPAKIGSICPSSHYLAHALVELALSDNTERGLIIDLGAGSGVISRELLKCGIPPDHILALDISKRFRRLFRKKCPEIKLYIEDARNLDKILANRCPPLPVKAVISSLPLRTMPLNTIKEIMAVINMLLAQHNGILIQYTYAMYSPAFLEEFGFEKKDTRHVVLNLPPALVEKYLPVKQQTI